MDAIMSNYCGHPALGKEDEEAFAHAAHQLGKLMDDPSTWRDSRRVELIDAAWMFIAQWALLVGPLLVRPVLLRRNPPVQRHRQQRRKRAALPSPRTLEYMLQCARMLVPPPTAKETPTSVAARVANMGFPINEKTFGNKWPEAWKLWVKLPTMKYTDPDEEDIAQVPFSVGVFRCRDSSNSSC